MRWYNILHSCLFILLLSSCARQSAPTGGPKDTIPPVLVRSEPGNETINFKDSEIQLLFSEDITLNAPKEQLIVTPTIGKEYKITARKNTVLITLAEPLADSTTYTFNFRETVQDLTEKNPARNLQLAFSTGDYIDSLSIEGKVYDLLKGTEVKNATVALHVENDTFSIYDHPAVYFTKTNDKGQFRISHLKPDNYFLYAFDDKNRNLKADTRSEAYGFVSEPLYLLENLKARDVGVLRLDARPLKITSARPYNTYYNIRTTKNLRTFQLVASDSSNLRYTFGEDQANIRVYRSFDQDSLRIRLIAVDSIDNKIDTTLYAKFLEREVTPEKFDVAISNSTILAEKGKLEATITLTKPLLTVNQDSIYFRPDSVNRINISRGDIDYDPFTRKITINKNLDRNLFTTPDPSLTPQPSVRAAPATQQQKGPQANTLILGKGAFISVENDSSKSLNQAIPPVREASQAVINVEIRTSEPAFLVQLVDNNFKVVREIRNRHKVRFENVTPGEYKLRLMVDRNSNGRWDPGNYLTKTEPEPVIYYRAPDGSTTLKGVKANWEIGAGEMFITY